MTAKRPRATKPKKAPAKAPAKKARTSPKTRAARARNLSVAVATERDIKAIAGTSKALGRGGLAAAALALARTIDDSETSASAKASCVRQLRDTLDALRRAATAEKLEQLRETARSDASAEETTEPKDRVVDIRDRRKARRARSTDT